MVINMFFKRMIFFFFLLLIGCSPNKPEENKKSKTISKNNDTPVKKSSSPESVISSSEKVEPYAQKDFCEKLISLRKSYKEIAFDKKLNPIVKKEELNKLYKEYSELLKKLQTAIAKGGIKNWEGFLKLSPYSYSINFYYRTDQDPLIEFSGNVSKLENSIVEELKKLSNGDLVTYSIKQIPVTLIKSSFFHKQGSLDSSTKLEMVVPSEYIETIKKVSK